MAAKSLAVVLTAVFVCGAAWQPGELAAQQDTQQDAEVVAGEAALTIHVTGLKPKGTLRVGLFDGKTGFPRRDKTCQSVDVPVKAKEATLEIPNLAAGTYAVAVFHDTNDNGKMDKSGFGMPTEPYGFSNNARGSFGPPSFTSASFELGAAGKQLQIKVQ